MLDLPRFGGGVPFCVFRQHTLVEPQQKSSALICTLRDTLLWMYVLVHDTKYLENWDCLQQECLCLPK